MDRNKNYIDIVRRPEQKARLSMGKSAAKMTMLEKTNEANRGLSLQLDQVTEAGSEDNFDLQRSHAEQFITWTKGEKTHPEIAYRAQQIHGECYVNFGYFTKDGLMDDMRLYPELDGTREKEGGGIDVTYLLAQSKNNHPSIHPAESAESSLRIIDIAEGSTIESLPAYGYGENNIYPKSRAKLRNIIELYGHESVREIAAMATLNAHDRSGTQELMRAIIQNAIVKNDSNHGKREVWIAALTDVSLKPVSKFVGAAAIEQIGDAAPIYTNDPRSSKDLHVTPVMIDPCKIPDGIVDSIEATEDPKERQKLVTKLRFLADGLTDEQIGMRAVNVMRAIETRHAS